MTKSTLFSSEWVSIPEQPLSHAYRSDFFRLLTLVKPGNESLIAAGTWCPSKNEINTIRNNLLRSSTRLRSVISSPEFVALFGKAKPHPKVERQNVWGMHDELKVAQKGVDKNHKDIDLLKCRSFAVAHKYVLIFVFLLYVCLYTFSGLQIVRFSDLTSKKS